MNLKEISEDITDSTNSIANLDSLKKFQNKLARESEANKDNSWLTTYFIRSQKANSRF